MDDYHNRPPLDIACANKNMDPKVVQLFLNTWPESTQLYQDGLESRCALHTLCERRREDWEGKCAEVDDAAAVKILRLLVEADPNSVQWTDGTYLPLHIAAFHNESPAFCQILIDAYPDSVKENVYYGTALFNACIQHPNNRLDTVRYLFDVYPEAIELVQTASRKAPLECALSNREERAGEQQRRINKRTKELYPFWKFSLNTFRSPKIVKHWLCKIATGDYHFTMHCSTMPLWGLSNCLKRKSCCFASC